MDKKKIIIVGLIIVVFILIASIALLTSMNNQTQLNNNTTELNNTTQVNTATVENVVSESSSSQSSSKYEQREAGLYNTETGRYEGGQADGCTQEYIDQYKYDMEHGGTGKYITVDPYG